MFCIPVHFHKYLNHHGLADDIYKAMGSDDLADPVMTVLNILKKTNNLPPVVKPTKSESKSTSFRNNGNKAYGEKKYQTALICYNKALLFAPNKSRAMKLAYSNRSALFHQIKAPSACIADIDTVFSMSCPLDIVEKLRKRKDEAHAILWMEHLAQTAKMTVLAEEYFKFNVKRNPQIPCASTEVGVIIENEVPKIVATTDIKVGSVLAVETAFVSLSGPENSMFSCYYCHKMNLNLQPCNGCCMALFCDEECRETCMREYHAIECKFVETLEATSGAMSNLTIRAFLKMKYMSRSWKELITASYSTGLSRVKTSSINEIYDSKQKLSLLNFRDERHLLSGPLYNNSFTCAAFIHYFDSITGFFPQAENEKIGAERATARLLMFLSLYAVPTQIFNCVSVNEQEKCEIHSIANYGWFSFAGKLNNSCMPNVMTVGLNKKIGLLALAPIKKGTELTISYVRHWLEDPNDNQTRHHNMLTLHRVVCNCIICTEEYQQLDKSKLTDMQKKNFKKLNLEEMAERFHPRNIPEIFMKLCKVLAFLSDMPFSDEYAQVFRLFRRCMLFLQDIETDNVILDYV